MTQRVFIYDTTLRDGCQCEDVNLSAPDKIKIALRLDEFGIDYIEGGWPGSNPVDVAFFQEIGNHALKHSRIAAFGSTHHPAFTAETDPESQCPGPLRGPCRNDLRKVLREARPRGASARA